MAALPMVGSPGSAVRRSPTAVRRDLDSVSPSPSPSPSPVVSRTNVAKSSITNNPQFGIWQKKAQVTAREQARWQVALAVFIATSIFSLILVAFVSYNDPADYFEITAKETRLIEVGSYWYSSVNVNELRGEIVTYTFKERPLLVPGPLLEVKETFKLAGNQIRYFARYLHEGSRVTIKVRPTSASYEYSDLDKLRVIISKGTQSLNNGFNGLHLESKDVKGKELRMEYVVTSADDYYFTLERHSLHKHHQISADQFDDNGNSLKAELNEEAMDLVEGEIELLVVPMVHDITYANDWERGSIVKDIPMGESHFLVLTNPDLSQVALSSVVMQDREGFLVFLFIGGEFLVALITVAVLNFSAIFGSCSCCPSFKRAQPNSRIRGFGTDSTMK